MAKVKAYYKHNLSNLVASATAPGYDAENLLALVEGSLWKGVGTGDHTILFNGAANNQIGVNYLAIANHNLAGATIMLEYSDDNFVSDINDAWTYDLSSFPTSDYDPLSVGPRGIAYSTLDDTLFLSDANTNKVYHVEKDGTLIDSFPTSTYDPSATGSTGLAYAPNNTLFVSDSATDIIYNIEIDGTFISSFPITIYDPSATSPTSITCSYDGTLFICDALRDAVYHLKSDGALIAKFPTSKFDAGSISPTGITYSADNTLFVCDEQTDTIYNIKTDGTLIASFPTSIYDAGASAPRDIAYAPDGTLWLTDTDLAEIFNVLRPPLATNKPFVIEFDTISERHWRIKLTNLSAVPFIGIAYWGLSAEWDYPALFDPDTESNKANVNVSSTGYLLAINNKFIERSIRLKFKRADDGGALWQALKQWWDNHGLNLMFIAWDTDNHPDDIYFVYPDPKFRGPFTTANRREVSLTFKGRV